MPQGFAKKNIFSFFIPYAYSGRTNYEKHIFGNVFAHTVNAIFVESFESKREITKMTNKRISQKLTITGYSKMDDITLIEKTVRDRKKIIIAPHHTINQWKNHLSISNFLDYSDFFLELPSIYQI
jgi:hypothetical protein